MKATHKGHCQICGRQQLLPNGKLSNHGYTVHKPHGSYGFFIGTCRGAKQLPFEQDITLVIESIEWAERMAARHEELAAETRTQTDKVWVHEYTSGRNYGEHSRYEWRELPLNEVTVNFGLNWTGRDGKSRKAECYGVFADADISYEEWKADTALQLRTYVKHLNEQKAKQYDREAKDFRSYKADQERRIKNWKPTELEPVK